MRRSRHIVLAASLVATLVGCGDPPARETSGGDAAVAPSTLPPVDDARLRAAADEPESWLTHGGSYAEQRYSQLDQIHERNVAELGLAWSFDLASERGVESTPLIADGVFYVTAPWSVVHALDAATGEKLWTHDPRVPREYSRKICCGVVNRGAAL